ncbi:TonB family protein [Leisingera sp. ANG59]|uniref:TonB family protein n=1 Tax=Leisingera sp. ANG59 TaxID=2675221 RepID=UPI0015743528|nr:TonB family protein [Leisingera sp. ANG59]NSY41068.1 TonB family protein [Leisingera sp. ANG59]
MQERAAGSSRQQAKGDAGADAATTGDSDRTASLKNRWGAAIISRVERQKRPPRGGGEGTVRLHLTVSTHGRLLAVSVTRSSGSAKVDQAAVAAVKKARMPRAPKALAPGGYSFTFRTTFTG